MSSKLQPSKLHAADLLRAATVGIRTRKQRAALSALGIMIGIAAMVAVLGLSQSSQAELIAQLERLGTNLLTVTPDAGLGQGDGTLPETAAAMIARIPPIESTSMLSAVDTAVYRNDHIPAGQTGGISVQAVDLAFDWQSRWLVSRAAGGTALADRSLADDIGHGTNRATRGTN